MSATLTDDDAAQNGTTDTARSNNQSENALIFGSVPSHLFDDIAIRIDNILTEEIASLPLLPRKKDGAKESGEEILLNSLRNVYKKNLDRVEAYCERNVFTIESFNKTKRRKILEHFLNGNDRSDSKEGAEEAEATLFVAKSKFEPPGKDEELPTAQQIMSMDHEILLARKRLHSEKQRRAKLSRQIQRLNGAMESLQLVQSAMKGKDGKSFDELQDKIQKAVDGHQEIKGWNGKAEEVIQLLDKIKAERDGAANDGGSQTVARDADEKERRRAWEEMNGGEAGREGARSHGTGEEIASLLKKLREK